MLPSPPKGGCCWETFYIVAYSGLVGTPHLTAKIESTFLLPFHRQPRKGGEPSNHLTGLTNDPDALGTWCLSTCGGRDGDNGRPPDRVPNEPLAQHPGR